jgi:hypothetical protein
MRGLDRWTPQYCGATNAMSSPQKIRRLHLTRTDGSAPNEEASRSGVLERKSDGSGLLTGLVNPRR